MGPPGTSSAVPPSSHDRNVQHKGCNIRTSRRHSDHGPDLAADRTGRRHHGAARRAARRSRSSLAELTRRLGVNKSTGHAILDQPGRRRVGAAATPPARRTGWGRRWSRSGARAAGVVPRARLRPARAWSSSAASSAPPAPRSAWATTRVTVLDQVADPRAGRATRSGSGRRSRCARRSAPRWWRGRRTRCATSGCAQVPADTRAHYADALVATHDRGFAVEIRPRRWHACASS